MYALYLYSFIIAQSVDLCAKSRFLASARFLFYLFAHMDYSAYHNVLTMYEISVCFSVYLSENIMLCIHVKHFLSCCLHPLVPPSLLFDISRLSKAIFPCSPPLELYTILSEKGIRKLLFLHPTFAFAFYSGNYTFR